MATRVVDLTIDHQNRMSVGKLGLKPGHARAEELEDGSGWVIRKATLYTEAELDVLSNPQNVADLQQALEDVEAGRIVDKLTR